LGEGLFKEEEKREIDICFEKAGRQADRQTDRQTKKQTN